MIRAYARTAERLLAGQPKQKTIARFVDGHCYTAYKTQHLTRQSRAWRLFWRLKNIRPRTNT